MESMYLYDLKRRSVGVYELKPKLKDIKSFREEELSRVGKTFVHRETVSVEPFNGSERYTIFYPFKNDNEVVSIDQVNFDWPIKKYERQGVLIPFYDGKFVQEYVDGEINNPKLVIVQELEKIRYFLLRAKEEYKRVGDLGENIDFMIRPILEINKELYILENILKRKFSLIKEENVEKQLKLFDINFCANISLNELRKIEDFVSSVPMETIDNYIDTDKILINKMKK